MIPSPTGKGRFLLAAFLGAILLHVLLIFLWKLPTYQPPEFAVVPGDTSLEVELVANVEPAETIATQAVEPTATPQPVPTPEATPPPEPAPTPEVEPEPVPVPVPMALPSLVPEPVSEKSPVPISQPTPSPRKASMATKKSVISGATSRRPSRLAGGKASRGATSSQPGYLRNPHPTYPEAARQAGQEGIVHLRVSISATGMVTSVRLERSSGHSALDQQAMTTVRQRWKFKPATENGKRVSAEISLPIRFQLK